MASMFELYQLRYFLAVVETGSFTKAAERACVTQPTLSAGIQKLEANLRVKLINRSNRRVFLTEAGTQFLERAKTILHQCTLAEVELCEIEAPRVVRLGVLMTIPADRIARLAGGFRKTEPGVVIELFEGTEQEIANRLDGGALDLALTIKRDSVPTVGNVSAVSLLKEGYVLALSEDHHLADRTTVSGRALAQEPTIVRTRCELLSETSRYFTDQNVRPRLVYRTPQDERALRMVAAGLGFTTLPECYEMPGIKKLKLEGYDYRREIALYHGAPQWNPEKQSLVTRMAAYMEATGLV